MRISLAPLACSLLLAGCGLPYREYSENSQFTAPMAYTTGDVRVIMQRNDHLGRTVTCTEPSPDVAKAVSTIASIQAEAKGVSGSAAFGSQEALAELAGRSTALLGLRDGLFRACEAYANGAIGDDAYALIISRYGQVMATLFLGQDAMGAGSNGELARLASMALQAAGSGGNGNYGAAATQVAGTGQAAGNTQQGDAGGQPKKTSAVGLDKSVVLAAWNPGFEGQSSVKLTQAGTDTGATGMSGGGGASGAGTPGGGHGGGTGGTAPTVTNNTSGTIGGNSTQATGTSAGAQAAADIEAMHRNLLNLDQNPLAMLHLILVACSNEFDPTRADVSRSQQYNGFLQQLCMGHGLQDLVRIIATLVPLTKQLEPPLPSVATASSNPARGSSSGSNSHATLAIN